MLVWILFIVFIVVALILDLGVFNRKAHEIKTKEALIWTTVWVSCAILFSGVVYLSFQRNWIENPTQITPYVAVIKYVTSYLIELSLSVDNIFVIALIFSSFAIPKKYQHEVLFYGVLGAIVFRAIMIVFGVALIHKFSWIIYVFGAFLVFTALKMLFTKHSDFDPKTSRMFRLIKKVFPVTHELHEDKLFIKRDHVRMATPLFVALIIIELSDVFFAVDSIPAVLSITPDPFLAFSSNILAVMGLRSMYFLISGMLNKFRYINYSLVIILAFVGVKMLLSKVYEFNEWVSLGIIILALVGGILASVLLPQKSDLTS